MDSPQVEQRYDISTPLVEDLKGITGVIDRSDQLPLDEVFTVSEVPHFPGELSNSTDSLDHETQNAINQVWLGTSKYFSAQGIPDQDEEQLASIVLTRQSLIMDVAASPYDPLYLLILAYYDNQTGFCEIAAANADRALMLIKAAFSSAKKPLKYHTHIRNAISTRMGSSVAGVIQEELLSLRKQAFYTLGVALLGCEAYLDGLKQMERALTVFPADTQLIDLREALEVSLQVQLTTTGDDEWQLRNGIIYPRLYPWLEKKLFMRTPALVREYDNGVGDALEIRRTFFGSMADQTAGTVCEEEDVGSLGIFAKRDIRAGEKIMVDTTLVCVSNIPSSTMEYCDACHAVLCLPFVISVYKPSCCEKVAFCSRKCHDTAVNGYHKIVCGINFDWLFKSQTIESEHNSYVGWKAATFLRVIAIILADNLSLAPDQKYHPLAHPLLVQLTASYDHWPYSWRFAEDVTLPTKILLKLGINIFTNPDFSQEVIQTILLRLDNNINSKTTNFIAGRPAHMYSINPHYIFFNHACDFNVRWHGAPASATEDITHFQDMDGHELQPGRSAVWCFAARDIKAGEECKISYVSNPMGDEKEGRSVKRKLLTHWLGHGGCGCSVCEKENEEEVESQK